MLTCDEIRDILPHRNPFLLVDRVLEMEEDRIHARKCVTRNEPYFAGHFPEHAVMPGVLIVEALAQTGAILLLSQPEHRKKLAYFAGINKMRFKKQVVPGDVLDLHVQFTRSRGSVYFARVHAMTEGTVVCEGEILCALGDAHD
ncbi:3-hydroxyacyl-ACP dehydratase FabZ [Faecalibaculum rodentium]|uniref:3-hydroxyacyl-ACP dehydratase FabZ n=1 Tax=Faecalibaculum rodentium TaxID=1702221 RepID=UPI002730B902|nr:3-hydroxyacyl-ACP dehydratase FabZ [Faecalibaculum rodentium]